MTSLRSQIIRLAHLEPGLRPHLLRILTGSKFDLEEFKAAKDKCAYVLGHAKSLAKGSWRWVWDIGGGKVLKLNMENSRESEKEIRVWECLKDDTVLARIYDYAKDGSWIVMEKLRIPTGEEIIKSINSILKFPDGLELNSNRTDLYDLSMLIENHKDSGTAEWDPLAIKRLKGLLDLTSKRLEWLREHPVKWWESILRLSSECGLDHRDLGTKNWGLRGSIPVILDYGYGQ